MQYTVERSGTIHLGKQGEHRARELALPDLTVWEAEHGPGEAEIIFLPPGGKRLVSITPDKREDETWLWTVTALETAYPGYGKCELRYLAGGAVVKSATYQTYVAGSLGEGTPVPETDPDDVPQEKPAEMPLLTDAESGVSYALVVEGGRLMLQEAGDRGTPSYL